MAKNERTAQRVAKIAGQILAIDIKDKSATVWCSDVMVCHWKELKMVAASCLTQAPDKPKKAKR